MPQFLVTMRRAVSGTRTVRVLVTAPDADRARVCADGADLCGEFPEGAIEITDMADPAIEIAPSDEGTASDYALEAVGEFGQFVVTSAPAHPTA
jgi:hypothetical protein